MSHTIVAVGAGGGTSNFGWILGFTIGGIIVLVVVALVVPILQLARSIGTSRYTAQLRRTYAKLESISVDYAILERVTAEAAEPQVMVIPAEVGWSDIGSWAAVYELLAREPSENIFVGQGHSIDANGNYFSANGRFVAAIGVKDLIVVETPDALLVCPRDRAQDVGKLVKWLEEQKLTRLL